MLKSSFFRLCSSTSNNNNTRTAASVAASSASVAPSSSSFLRKGRPPISEEQVRELFSISQRSTWPPSYRPTVGVSALLQKEGVELQQLVDIRKDLQEDRKAELGKDLAYDMNLWTRCAFEEEMSNRNSDSKRRRMVRRVLQRDRLPSYSEVVSYAKVPNLSSRDDIPQECRDLPGVQTSAKELQKKVMEERKRKQQILTLLQQKQQKSGGSNSSSSSNSQNHPALIKDGRYPFTSQGMVQQDQVFSVLDNCQTLHDRVLFPDFPSLYNLLHHQYDSCSFLKYISSRTGDELLISQEFVRELALYLRRRLEEINTSENDKTPNKNKNSTTILFLFSNGRLPKELKESALISSLSSDTKKINIVGTNTRKRLVRRDQVLPVFGKDETPSSYCMEFPVEVIPVVDALVKYRPSIVIAEPHCDRDYTCEMRGFESVREVILLGQVDSSAMCSFSYPWLSFGCAPSRETYFAYNSLFQKLNVPSDSQFMPMDAPYVQQGYEKLYVDSLSRWMVCSNDTMQSPNQSRCCVFRRK